MTQFSRCGLPAPLDASFDCTAHTTTPPDAPPLANMNLVEKNKENLRIEKKNTISVDHTRLYEKARATTAGVGDLDVSAPLEPFYAYIGNKIELMASSKDVVSAVGPLPSFVILKIAELHMKTVQDEASEKARKEKDKSNSFVPVIGSLRMVNPVQYSSVLSDVVSIPAIFLESINQKLWPPLHWWADSILRDAERNPQFVPSVPYTPKQTSPTLKVTKVQVIDWEKMTDLHGGLEHWTSLTPSTWRQCSKNLMTAVSQLSTNDATIATPASELAKHLQFFAANRWYDELFHVWYPLELELRAHVLFNTLFNPVSWSSELSICVSTHYAAVSLSVSQHVPPAHAESSGRDRNGRPTGTVTLRQESGAAAEEAVEVVRQLHRASSPRRLPPT
ncbi:hypothetical protein B0H13DRAFT_1915590 [Mycena leptocephala]|nr:hypothetical protein B0H13DRAFT_1915590 [Mycena leptocephala]